MCPLLPAWGLVVAVIEVAYAQSGFSTWALAHAVLALGTYGAWRGLGRPTLLAVRAAALTLALPVVGAGVAIALGRGARTLRPELPEPAGRPLLGPQEAPPLPGRYRGVWELEAALLRGDLEARLSAVTSLKALEGPDGVRILRAALTAPDHQVSLLATLALSELETEFESAIRQGRAAGPLALAEALVRYAGSGLPGGAVITGLWRQAVEAAVSAAEAEAPEHRVPACRLLATAQLALQDAEGALAAAEAGLALAPLDADLGLRRLEALFRLGRTDRLQAAARELAALAPPDHPAHAVARYWSPPDAALARL